MSGSGRLSGKVAVVTGGASGIGEAIVRALAREGAAVAIADINAAAGGRLAEELTADAADASFVRMNVADAADVQRGVEVVRDRYGRLDVFVNNAGIGGSPRDDAGWWRLFDVDLLGTAWGTAQAVAAMRDGGGGSIVDIGSHAGQYGCRTGPYGAAKAGVHTLMRYTSLRHAADGVRANAVLPGNIYTTIHDPARQEAIARYVDGDHTAFDVDPLGRTTPETSKEEVLADFRRRHPMGRLAEVEDIARAVLFLASDDARVVTGNEFAVTGGVLPKRLSDRLAASAAVARWPEVPAPPDGTIAIVSGNTPLSAALADEFAGPGVTPRTAPAGLLGDEEGICAWLENIPDLAGIVFAIAPDPGGTLFDQTPALWRDQLTTTVRIPWLLGARAADAVAPGGSLTFVSDAAGITGAGGSPAFCATAAALAYFADGFAEDHRARGLRVNCVVAEQTSSPPARAGLGSAASAEDVAGAVHYLSRGSQALTGARMILETAHP
jgi:3(or 17)beta-hydroxysteroid dehydrogenase